MSGYILFDKDLSDDGRILDLGDLMYELLTPGITSEERNALRNASPVLYAVAHNAVVGGLARLWWYADTYVRADNTLRISLKHLAEKVHLPVEILRAMPNEWLTVRDDGVLEVPQYIEKNAILNKDLRRERDRANNAERQQRWRDRHKGEGRNDDRNGDGALRVTDSNALARAGVTHVRSARPTPNPTPNPNPMPTHTEGVSVPRETGSEEGADPDELPGGWIVTFKLTYPDADQPHNWRSFKREAHKVIAAGKATPATLIAKAASYKRRCDRKKTTGGRYVMSPVTFITEEHYLSDWERGLTGPVDEWKRLRERRDGAWSHGISMADFRDPLDGETPDEYRRAQDDEHANRIEAKRVARESQPAPAPASKAAVDPATARTQLDALLAKVKL